VIYLENAKKKKQEEWARERRAARRKKKCLKDHTFFVVFNSSICLLKNSLIFDDFFFFFFCAICQFCDSWWETIFLPMGCLVAGKTDQGKKRKFEVFFAFYFSPMDSKKFMIAQILNNRIIHNWIFQDQRRCRGYEIFFFQFFFLF